MRTPGTNLPPPDQLTRRVRGRGSGRTPEIVTVGDLAVLDALGAGGIWPIFGRELRFTNLDKVMLPARLGEEPVPLPGRRRRQGLLVSISG